MLAAITALVVGIVLLLISADKFVDGASAIAGKLGLSPLLIGMLIIGFGSSAPEMLISGLAASEGNPGLALGNAFGSNITNIALILGVTALVRPIAVSSSVLLRELPLLTALTAIVALLIVPDAFLSSTDGWILTVMFMVVMGWSIQQGRETPSDNLGDMVEQDLKSRVVFSTTRSVIYLIGGLLVLVLSSRILVWGGVEIATRLGVSDLIIGLTIVAVGTSLPELASSIAAVRKNEHALAIGNVIGSNIFNSSIVIGITGVIAPTAIEHDMIARDFPILVAMTLALFFMGYAYRGPGTGRISRMDATLLVSAYIAYNVVLLMTAIGQSG
jgi:cation:H+ antiporter